MPTDAAAVLAGLIGAADDDVFDLVGVERALLDDLGYDRGQHGGGPHSGQGPGVAAERGAQSVVDIAVEHGRFLLAASPRASGRLSSLAIILGFPDMPMYFRAMAGRRRLMATKLYIIALEEHYYDPEVKGHFRGLDAITAPAIVQRLDDLGELRLREMDEAGIDMQVLSHSMPGFQKLDAETAVPLARRANDRLGEAVPAHPDRFPAFPPLPTAH